MKEFNHLLIETNCAIMRKHLKKPQVYNIRKVFVYDCRELFLSDAPDARDNFFRAQKDIVLTYGQDIFKPNLKPWCGAALRRLAQGLETQIVINSIYNKGVHYKLYFCETTNAPFATEVE